MEIHAKTAKVGTRNPGEPPLSHLSPRALRTMKPFYRALPLISLLGLAVFGTGCATAEPRRATRIESAEDFEIVETSAKRPLTSAEMAELRRSVAKHLDEQGAMDSGDYYLKVFLTPEGGTTNDAQEWVVVRFTRYESRRVNVVSSYAYPMSYPYSFYSYDWYPYGYNRFGRISFQYYDHPYWGRHHYIPHRHRRDRDPHRPPHHHPPAKPPPPNPGQVHNPPRPPGVHPPRRIDRVPRVSPRHVVGDPRPTPGAPVSGVRPMPRREGNVTPSPRVPQTTRQEPRTTAPRMHSPPRSADGSAGSAGARHHRGDNQPSGGRRPEMP